jgi:hypothetical protein
MKSIKMERLELLSIVQANKIKHIQEFTESVEDFKNLVLQIAVANLKLAKTGDLNEFKKIKNSPTPPTSYEDSYKRAIRMLELSVEDIIEVEEDVLNQLVLDEWSWKRSFSVTNTMYKSGI